MVNKLLKVNQIQDQGMIKVEKSVIIRKIQETTKLPAMSVTVTQLVKKLRSDDVHLQEVIQLAEQDQALVAQILKIINSGLFGLRRKVESVGHAISLLGIMQLKNLVYSASVMSCFGEKEKDEWEHAYTSSLLMERLLKECGIRSSVSSDLPIGMLLHDIGKLILRSYSPTKYSMAQQHSISTQIPLSRAEEHFIHINHAEAASILLDKWEINNSISVPISWHHNVDKLPPDEYILETALIQFVNWVDCRVRERSIDEPSKKLLSAAGIDEIDKLYWVSSHRKTVNEAFKLM